MSSVFKTQRLHKHADYGLVYSASRKHASPSLSFFYRERAGVPAASLPSDRSSPRVGITVPRSVGGAVLRNRIKRRVRLAARAVIGMLPATADVVLHPRPAVAVMPYADLVHEMTEVFRRIEQRVAAGAVNTPLPRPPRSRKGARV